MSAENTLQETIRAMVQPGKGILAADESQGTIAKRFAAVDAECNEACCSPPKVSLNSSAP